MCMMVSAVGVPSIITDDPIARTSLPVISIFSYTSRNSCPVSIRVPEWQRGGDECHTVVPIPGGRLLRHWDTNEWSSGKEAHATCLPIFLKILRKCLILNKSYPIHSFIHFLASQPRVRFSLLNDFLPFPPAIHQASRIPFLRPGSCMREQSGFFIEIFATIFVLQGSVVNPTPKVIQYLIIFKKVHLVYILVSKIPVVDHISVEYRFFSLQFPENFVSGMRVFSTGPHKCWSHVMTNVSIPEVNM